MNDLFDSPSTATTATFGVTSEKSSPDGSSGPDVGQAPTSRIPALPVLVSDSNAGGEPTLMDIASEASSISGTDYDVKTKVSTVKTGPVRPISPRVAVAIQKG